RSVISNAGSAITGISRSSVKLSSSAFTRFNSASKSSAPAGSAMPPMSSRSSSGKDKSKSSGKPSSDAAPSIEKAVGACAGWAGVSASSDQPLNKSSSLLRASAGRSKTGTAGSANAVFASSSSCRSKSSSSKSSGGVSSPVTDGDSGRLSAKSRSPKSGTPVLLDSSRSSTLAYVPAASAPATAAPANELDAMFGYL